VFGSSQRPVIDDAKAALVNQELAAVVIGDRMIAIWLLEPSSESVEFEALTDTEFVLGSAVPHISSIRERLVQEGRL
jgi:hypothetical protein